jgi:integral membrane protein
MFQQYEDERPGGRPYGWSIESNRSPQRSAALRLGTVSTLETVSFIVLLAMMLTHNEVGVSAAGMVHGLLFLAYAWLVLTDREVFGWTWSFVIISIITGPIGAILVLERLRRLGESSHEVVGSSRQE